MSQQENHSFFDGMKDKGIIAGTVVLSKCGHDEGRIYVVASEQDSYLSLCDGDKRSLEAPKKKRRKHVSPLGQMPQAQNWLASLKELTVLQQSSEIRNGIRRFLDSHKEICDISERGDT